MDKTLYNVYVEILKEELVPAMGCTEPIAVAYAAALAARALGCEAEQVEVAASANIIKNVKSVVVPHTGGRRGIAAATAAGIVAGDPDKELEVLCGVTEDDLAKMAAFLEKTPIKVERSATPYLFDIQVRLAGGGHTAYAEIAGHHTNVIKLERDGAVLLQKEYQEQTSTHTTDHTLLNVEQIVQFADEAELDDVKEILQRQIDCNTAIAKQGLEGHWGAEIGRILLRSYGDTVHNRAKASAAAGGHQLRQRQSGSDHLSAGHRICPGNGCLAGAALPRPVGVQPDHHPPQDRHRTPVCLLRCHQRRLRRRCRHYLPSRGTL